jgi:anti-sigma factor RsiW
MSDRVDKNEWDLSALVDGELGPERRAEAEARIKVDSTAVARLEAYRADKEKLRRIFEPIAQRPIPAQWLAIADSSRPRTSRRMVGSIAAALLVAIVGVATYVELSVPAQDGIVQEALNARGDIAQPEKVIAVASGSGVDRYTGALRAAVGSDVKVPDMQKAGYRLVAIRVYAHGAAELAYRDGENRVFTLYVRRSAGSPRSDQFERDGLRVCIWQDEEISTVMAGNMSTAAMQRLASLAYTGLTL